MKQRDRFRHCKEWGQYKHWRNKTTTLLRASKKNFFSQSIAENKDNTFLWRHIKSLNGQNEGMKIQDEINIDGNTFKQKHDVIEQLNYFFSSISKRLKSDDSQTNDINEYDFTNLKDYVDSKVPNEINFKIPFMKDAELTNALQSLNTKKSTGLDGLSPKILKLSARIIGPSLLKMINYNINSGIFPDNLKIARLIPIHKGGPKDDPSNFRPISILSVISKLLEKHITKHLFAYLNKYDILHKSQSGFRKHHSCDTALINLVDKWLSNIDKGEVVGAIFYDLKKSI